MAIIQYGLNVLYPGNPTHVQAVSVTAGHIEAALGTAGIGPKMTTIGPRRIPEEYLKRIAKEANRFGLVFWQTGQRGFMFTRLGEEVSIPRYVPSKIVWEAFRK